MTNGFTQLLGNNSGDQPSTQKTPTHKRKTPAPNKKTHRKENTQKKQQHTHKTHNTHKHPDLLPPPPDPRLPDRPKFRPCLVSLASSRGIVVPVQGHGLLKLCVWASLGSFCVSPGGRCDIKHEKSPPLRSLTDPAGACGPLALAKGRERKPKWSKASTRAQSLETASSSSDLDCNIFLRHLCQLLGIPTQGRLENNLLSPQTHLEELVWRWELAASRSRMAHPTIFL